MRGAKFAARRIASGGSDVWRLCNEHGDTVSACSICAMPIAQSPHSARQRQLVQLPCPARLSPLSFTRRTPHVPSSHSDTLADSDAAPESTSTPPAFRVEVLGADDAASLTELIALERRIFSKSDCWAGGWRWT